MAGTGADVLRLHLARGSTPQDSTKKIGLAIWQVCTRPVPAIVSFFFFHLYVMGVFQEPKGARAPLLRLARVRLVSTTASSSGRGDPPRGIPFHTTVLSSPSELDGNAVITGQVNLARYRQMLRDQPELPRTCLRSKQPHSQCLHKYYLWKPETVIFKRRPIRKLLQKAKSSKNLMKELIRATYRITFWLYFRYVIRKRVSRCTASIIMELFGRRGHSSI